MEDEGECLVQSTVAHAGELSEIDMAYEYACLIAYIRYLRLLRNLQSVFGLTGNAASCQWHNISLFFIRGGLFITPQTKILQSSVLVSMLL